MVSMKVICGVLLWFGRLFENHGGAREDGMGAYEM
jgi:hypothetical protein